MPAGYRVSQKTHTFISYPFVSISIGVTTDIYLWQRLQTATLLAVLRTMYTLAGIEQKTQAIRLLSALVSEITVIRYLLSL